MALIRLGLPEVLVVLLQLSDIADKVEYAPVAGFLIGGRLLHQHVQIRPAHLAARQSRGIEIIPRPVINAVQQRMHGKNRRCPPELVDKRHGSSKLLSRLIGRILSVMRKICAHGAVKPSAASCIFLRCLFFEGLYLRKLVILQTAEGRPQHGGQGNILHRIVDNRQQIQDGLHLQSAEISAAGLRKGGDPLPHQNLGKLLRPSVGSPEKNHDIPVLTEPEALLPRIPEHKPGFRVGYPQNLPGDHSGLQLPFCELRSLIVRIYRRILRKVQQQKLRCHSPLRILRIGSAGVEGRFFRILHASQAFRHNLKEDVVGAGQDLIPAAEILLQSDEPVTLLLPVAFVLLQKQVRPRQAELIDTLFHIADHHHIRPPEALAGEITDQLLLHQVAVLVLIHQDLVEHLRELIRHRTGRMKIALFLPLPGEDRKGHMLQVAEIHDILFPLLPVKPLRELLRKRQKLQHMAGHEAHILLCCLRRQGKIRLHQLLGGLLYLGAGFIDQLLFCPVDGFRHLFPDGRHFLPVHVCRCTCHLPIAIRQRQALQVSRLLLYHRRVGPGPVRILTDRKDILKKPGKLFSLPRRIFPEKGKPGCLFLPIPNLRHLPAAL